VRRHSHSPVASTCTILQPPPEAFQWSSKWSSIPLSSWSSLLQVRSATDCGESGPVAGRLGLLLQPRQAVIGCSHAAAEAPISNCCANRCLIRFQHHRRG